ncbi:MAG: hypothetical protein ACLQMO_11395 [Acidobacteriaceae bacterium]
MEDRHYAKHGTTEAKWEEIARRMEAGEKVSYEERVEFFMVGFDGNVELAKKAAEVPELPEMKKPKDEE